MVSFALKFPDFDNELELMPENNLNCHFLNSDESGSVVALKQ